MSYTGMNVQKMVKLLSERLDAVRAAKGGDIDTITELTLLSAYITAALAAPMFAAIKESGGDANEGIDAMLDDMRALMIDKTNEAHDVLQSMKVARQFIAKMGGVQ